MFGPAIYLFALASFLEVAFFQDHLLNDLEKTCADGSHAMVDRHDNHVFGEDGCEYSGKSAHFTVYFSKNEYSLLTVPRSSRMLSAVQSQDKPGIGRGLRTQPRASVKV